MAYYYYPGYYDHSHLLQFYSQSLFAAVPPHTYADQPDDYHSPTSTTTSNGPLFSSLPRSSSPPRSSPPTTSTRARSTTPPAPPAHPSPSYVDFASKPSKTLSEPTRKLLVLDLNGTLLLRSPRPPRSFRTGHHHHHQQPSHPAPRRVMRRPYLAALRAYLFAPQTRAWLDVMVWSSAQPHSVEDMVAHALGNGREWLVAIWARDTLGLTGDHYHRKVQTIKDLEKPWAALTPPRDSRSPSPPYSPSVAAPKPKPQAQTSSPTWTGHSAATTILVDDSHAKAALQPHNHLCVLEYSRAQRNIDLVALNQLAEQQRHSAEDSAAASNASDGSPGKAHKRKKRKKAEAQAQLTADGAPAAAAAPAAAVFDETLLAVIGILHAARLQSSVAGWLRASALFQPLSDPGAGDDGDDGDGAKTWCDDPVLVRAWASRGREAMDELHLKVEHGVEA